MTVKILQKLEDRLKDVAENVGPCNATLYGTTHESELLIVGFSIQNESNLTIETQNPFGVDLVGIAEIRQPTSEEDLTVKLTDFPVKSPVVVNVTAAGSVKLRRFADGKLSSVNFDVLEDDEFLSSFMFVNFVAATSPEEIPENAEPAEEATEISSKLENIKQKLTSEPPNFKLANSDVSLDSEITPFDVFSENPTEKDPRLPENLAILPVELEFTYDTKFLRNAEGRDGILNNINTVCLVEKESSVNLLELLIGSILRNLSNFTVEQSEDLESRNFTAQIFYPPDVGYVLSAIFPTEASEEVLLKKRLLLHENLGLSTAKPNFTGSLALSHFFGPSPAIGYSGEKHLCNVHDTVKPPKLKDAQITTVRGIYSYFHYLQDGEKDDGWGCAYR